AAKVALVIVIVIVAGWFALRNLILEKAIARAVAKVEADYNSKLVVKEASFRGIGGIDLHGVSLVPMGADTLFRMRHISSDVNMMQLLTGKIQLQKLQVSDGFAQMVIDGTKRNYDAF